MVRSSRRLALLSLAALLLLPACGGDELQAFQVAITSPPAPSTEVPFPVAVVRGVATGVETLTLKVRAGDETYTFPARPGTTMAFRIGGDGESSPPPVTLAGLEVEAPSASEIVQAFEQRLAESVAESAVRKPVRGDAFVVDLPADREDLWPAIARAAAPPADLRFLIEVLPRERYRQWHEGRTSPRLTSPDAPWPDTAEAFDAFKDAEVARWLEARAGARPYAPSRPGLLVLPRAGEEAATVQDFAVLEWPANPEQRFDGRMLQDPVTAKDPNSGKPIVLYEVRESYQDAFEAWTGANVGMPMAIVLDWVVRSAPTINSALRDNVQITLGSGSWSELQAEAQALTHTLGSSTEGPPATLVAVCTWRPGGALEVLVPLEARVDTTLVVEGRGAAPDDAARVERTLRLVPGIEAGAADAVAARLAEMFLGSLEAEAAAPLLRGETAAAVEQLARVASGDVSNVRRRAAATLLGLLDPKSETAIRALVDLIDDADPELAAAAAHALEGGAKTDDAAFDALVRSATSDQPELQMAASAVLCEIGVDRREEILELTADEEPAIRMAAMRVLAASLYAGHDESPTVVMPVLLGRLEDPEGEVRRAALYLLQEQAWLHQDALRPHLSRVAATLADEVLEVRSAAAGCLGPFGSEILPVVQPYLDSDVSGTRAAAVMALIAVDEPSEEIVARIERAGDDVSLEVQLSAAMFRAAKRGDVASALPAARKGLQSDVPIERQLALGILWTGGEKAAEAAPWLEPLLAEDEEREIRVLAAATLKRMGKETARSREILAGVLADEGHPMHGFAVSLDQQDDTGR